MIFFKRVGLIHLLIISFCLKSMAGEQGQNKNFITLGGGIQIELPALPEDLTLREDFLNLTTSEQNSFYVKRKFLIQKLASGLTQPGFKSGVRWIKNQIFAFKDFAINEFTGAQTMVGQGENFPLEISQENLSLLLQLRKESTNSISTINSDSVLKWQLVPPRISSEAKAFVESTITGLVDNMWKNSIDIAKSNGLGLTFVGGTIFNTTFGKNGFVWGRSLSIDIGIDFKNQNGYIRFLYDKQALKNGGLSFDVGLMFDTLLHITNTEIENGENIEATHTKLPIIGCFRSGPNYKAWGTQMGVSVLEIAGGWLSLHGYPIIGSGLITSTRAIGMATIYSTSLNRRIIKTYPMPKFILESFGFNKLLDLSKQLIQPYNEKYIDNLKFLCKDVI